MEKLYSIMRDLLELEYNQKSLLYLLKTLETTYSEQQEETRLIANSTKYYLESLQSELKIIISRLDNYILEETKKR